MKKNEKYLHVCSKDADPAEDSDCMFCDINTILVSDDEECPVRLRKRVDEDEVRFKKIHEIILKSIHELSGDRICHHCDAVEDEECDVFCPVGFLRDASRIIENIVVDEAKKSWSHRVHRVHVRSLIDEDEKSFEKIHDVISKSMSDPTEIDYENVLKARLSNPIIVRCTICGAKPHTPCYSNGSACDSHSERRHDAIIKMTAQVVADARVEGLQARMKIDVQVSDLVDEAKKSWPHRARVRSSVMRKMSKICEEDLPSPPTKSDDD